VTAQRFVRRQQYIKGLVVVAASTVAVVAIAVAVVVMALVV
jgi:hypothetical protein